MLDPIQVHVRFIANKIVTMIKVGKAYVTIFIVLGGLGLPGEKDSWDFGEGAGFYVDALKEPWSNNYRMYSYVTKG